MGGKLNLGSAVRAAGIALALTCAAAMSVPAQGVNPVADESDMLARARAERTPVDQSTDVRGLAIEAQAQRRVQEAERQAELDMLSDKIRQRPADSARLPQYVIENAQPAATTPLPPIATRDTTRPEATEHSAETETGTRVTILLTMDAGDRGIRRFNPSADPVLCVGDTCYISRGPDLDARAMPRKRALGALNTLGDRAGACGNSLNCVFRNVDLGSASAAIQPVDLRVLKHDRRELSEVRADPTCKIDNERLRCTSDVRGSSYRLWAVTERLARQAGGNMLRTTLESGLGGAFVRDARVR